MSYLKGLADKVNRIEAKENFNLLEIDIDKLMPSTKNFYGIREVEELAESIKESGLMHNLVVRKINDGSYEILSGERRYHALKKLGYKKIPCQVKDMTDLDAEILLIQANAKQRELTAIEKMNGIKKLKELYDIKKRNGEPLPKGKKTRDVIGEEIGLSGSQVAKYQQVDNNLIGGLKDKFNSGDITLTQATTLCSLQPIEQAAIYDQIKSMKAKECKEEINMLVEGIKQPVDNKEDEVLVEEVAPTGETCVDQITSGKKITTEGRNNFKIKSIKELLEIDTSPKVVFNSEVLQGIVSTSLVSLKEDYFYIKLLDGSYINIKLNLSYARTVNYIKYGESELRPKKAWQINDEIYLWFKKKI